MTVFWFGSKPITTFEEHKREFGNKYNNGKDINFNDRKVIDFHEDVIKQMYIKMTWFENEMKQVKMENEKLKMENEKLHSLNLLAQTTKTHVEVLIEQVDYLMVEAKKQEDTKKMDEKKDRYIELMKELREIENDLKFYRKEN